VQRWPRRTSIVAIALALSACGDSGSDAIDDSGVLVLPTRPTVAVAPDDSSGVADGGAVSSRADVLRAGDAAVAVAGGEVVRTSVDLLGYVVQLRQSNGTFTNVQLDVGFGIVFVESDQDGRRDADDLAENVDLRRAVDLALQTAAGEEIGAADDGVVVGAEIERDGYDIDIQYPDGRVLEVRLDDDHVVTGIRIRG